MFTDRAQALLLEDGGRAVEQSEPAGDQTQSDRRSLLVLDDQHDIGELVCEFAATLGYSCAATTDPGAFVRAAIDLKPSVLVLDLQMPNLDGVQVLRQLGAKCCESYVLIASGAEQTVIEAAMRLGAACGLRMLGFVRKPLLIPGLLTLLHAGQSDWAALERDD